MYFIGLIVIGQRVLLNLFLAILLQNFDENTLREELQKNLEKSMDHRPALSVRLRNAWEEIKDWIRGKLRCRKSVRE